jgi:hypothetical protein
MLRARLLLFVVFQMKRIKMHLYQNKYNGLTWGFIRANGSSRQRK